MKKKTVLRTLSMVLILAMMITMVTGCSKKSEDKDKGNKGEKNEQEEVKATPTPAGHAPIDSTAVQVDVRNDIAYQNIEGFGAAYTWYSEWLPRSTYANEIYDALFKDGGMTILRFKNNYKYDTSKEFTPNTEKTIYEEAKKRINERGEEPTVLMCSWSPADYLKSNEIVYGGGSLKRGDDGNYMYNEYGEYWYELVNAYEKFGVPIDWISIQNECDFEAGYDGCEFAIDETENYASYAKAYLATYEALKKMENPPKMMGPETMTCTAATLKTYMKEVTETAPESIQGIAHHLYNGGTHTDPGSFNQNFRDIAEIWPDTSKWQTEFYRGNFLETMQIIQNSLMYENLNAYVYWSGIWLSNPGGTLVWSDGTNDESLWINEHGYELTYQYYAMRHFSEYIRPGYTRVGTRVGDDSKVTCSAYVSPNKQDKMVLVAINPTDEDAKLQFQLADYDLKNSKVILSNGNQIDPPADAIHEQEIGEVEGQNDTSELAYYNKDEFYKENGSLDENQCLTLPANCAATIVLEGSSDVKTRDGVKEADAIALENPDVSADMRESNSVDLDEKNNEWNLVKRTQISNVAHGDSGAAANFSALYRDNKLYVKVKVTDSTEGKEDSVDLFINETGNKPSTYGETDSHIIITRAGKVTSKAGLAADKVNTKVVADDKGYTIIAEIPMQTITIGKSTKIGFDVQINDFNYTLKWSDSSLTSDKDLSRCGYLRSK